MEGLLIDRALSPFTVPETLSSKLFSISASCSLRCAISRAASGFSDPPCRYRHSRPNLEQLAHGRFLSHLSFLRRHSRHELIVRLRRRIFSPDLELLDGRFSSEGAGFGAVCASGEEEDPGCGASMVKRGVSPPARLAAYGRKAREVSGAAAPGVD